MSKTRVRRHTRRVNGKPISVSKHNRHIKGSTISRQKRGAFTALATQPYEVGGQLDFTHGKLDNARMHFGDDSSLEFPFDPDYEVSWHTHPKLNNFKVSIMPSYDDLISMKETDEKEQVIFKGSMAISIAEGKKFSETPISKIKLVSKNLGRDLDLGMSDKELYRKYKPIFKHDLGLEMGWHTADSDINLKTRSV
jgi:hypothetical protein